MRSGERSGGSAARHSLRRAGWIKNSALERWTSLVPTDTEAKPVNDFRTAPGAVTAGQFALAALQLINPEIATPKRSQAQPVDRRIGKTLRSVIAEKESESATSRRPEGFVHQRPAGPLSALRRRTCCFHPAAPFNPIPDCDVVVLSSSARLAGSWRGFGARELSVSAGTDGP
ncbi:hypothetical protein AOLI_G00143730 [Acnodon oligacanthus]